MKLINIVLVATCIILPVAAMAQPGFINNTTDTPIDGGVTLLIAGAIGYGAKKRMQGRLRRKK